MELVQSQYKFTEFTIKRKRGYSINVWMKLEWTWLVIENVPHFYRIVPFPFLHWKIRPINTISYVFLWWILIFVSCEKRASNKRIQKTNIWITQTTIYCKKECVSNNFRRPFGFRSLSNRFEAIASIWCSLKCMDKIKYNFIQMFQRKI